MSQEITILDLKFKPYINASEIDAAISKMAQTICADYGDSHPLFICVLNGSFIFASDLIKKISIPCNIEFVRLKSYSGTQTTENVCEIIGLHSDIQGRDIIILEDIVDTGHTLDKFLRELQRLSPKSIKIASLIFKKEAFQKNFAIDYLGFEIENKFIVGYGLDYNEYGRNLPEIYQIV